MERKDPQNKGFWARLLEKLDKKMEEKAKGSSCCCSSKKKDGRPCCK
ncbi:MAG: hypothetical protein JW788_06315 [Candidatus Omnitrophica bacterium]|nr:hypothetical protein [Candidatus Omnitrophota bacterium]